MMKPPTDNTGPLAGLRVFDLTRVLAGPAASQTLGDLGAEIIKVVRPGYGDDTRTWGPPFMQDAKGVDTSESAYYLCANRNKKSMTLDFTMPEGQKIARQLLAGCDILIENFKPGKLDRYGLGYEQLKEDFPQLIYCALTGFGHSGPYQNRPGYDFMIQAMGGLMSLTGPPEGMPYKTGVAISDLMAGMYALTGILAALHHRGKTGKGQFIDVSLFDTQVAWLANAGQYYLTSGTVMPRMGNAHSVIVPYETFEAADGWIVLAIGNDRQFADFCDDAGRSELAQDPRFVKNKDRVKNRDILIPIIREIIKQHPRQYWIDHLKERNIPGGPVNDIAQVFDHPQTKAREMTVTMDHPAAEQPVTMIANPLKFSGTPVSYRHPPPSLGEHTKEILTQELSMSEEDIQHLREKGVI